MKAASYDILGFQQLTSTGTGNVVAATIPVGINAILVSVETTDARITLDGSAPSASAGHLFKAGLQPVLVPIGAGSNLPPTVKVASSAAATSVVDITYLT